MDTLVLSNNMMSWMFSLLSCVKISTKNKRRGRLFLFLALYMCLTVCSNSVKALIMSLFKVEKCRFLITTLYEGRWWGVYEWKLSLVSCRWSMILLKLMRPAGCTMMCDGVDLQVKPLELMILVRTLLKAE